MKELKELYSKGYKLVTNWQECSSKSIFFLNTLNLENFNKYQKLAIKKNCTHIIFNSSLTKYIKNKNTNYHSLNIEKDLFKLKKIFFVTKKLKIIFITGTNGKTSIAYGAHLLSFINNRSSCYIGTIGFYINGRKIKNLSNTTPSFMELASLLNVAANQKIKYAFIETSSIGFKEGRLGNLKYDLCYLTNLQSDHLDFHKNIKNYHQSKIDMINTHSKINSNILVQDKNIYKKISKFRYRIEFLDDFTKSQEINLIKKNYYSYLVKTKNRNFSINTMHDFMIQNFLSMLHIFFKLHKKFPEKVNTKIFPDGRSEIIYKKNNMIILVDYAHTKEAFENLLSNLPRDKLHKIIIFGCGGNRDKSKRSKMAKVASKYTDIQIITDDNPRNENPSSIRKTLCQNSSNYIEIPSRQRAIERGVKLLKKKKGLLLIAGKGHENIQIYKNKIFKFNDRKVAKSYAKSL